MIIKKYRGKSPEIDKDAFIAENATIIGDVKIGKGANVWYGAVIRGDENSIEIGENTNVQDNATVHTCPPYPVKIGNNVTIGHNAIVHGTIIGDNTLIGMGACVMNGSVIGNNCIIAAGALVPENMIVPDGKMLVGIPAVIKKDLTPAHIEKNAANALLYVDLGKEYKEDME